MIGMVMVAPIYLILLYAILGMARFNPHWELEDSGQLYSEKLGEVSKVYGQYALVSLGILGFVPTTFLEATQKMFEQRFAGPVGTGSPIYAALYLPYLLSQIALSAVGCIGLGIGIVRELHIKQHEALLLPFSIERKI